MSQGVTQRFCPAIREPSEEICPSPHFVSLSEAGIEFSGATEQRLRCIQVISIQVLPSLQKKVIGSPMLRRFTLRSVGSTGRNPSHESSGDCVYQVVLNFE